MRKILAVCAVLMLSTPSSATQLAELRAKKPEFSDQVTMSQFEIERCVVEHVNIGMPWVYRQADRPDAVDMVWVSRELKNVTLLELRGSPEVKLRFWGKDKMWQVVQYCIGHSKILPD